MCKNFPVLPNEQEVCLVQGIPLLSFLLHPLHSRLSLKFPFSTNRRLCGLKSLKKNFRAGRKGKHIWSTLFIILAITVLAETCIISYYLRNIFISTKSLFKNLNVLKNS